MNTPKKQSAHTIANVHKNRLGTVAFDGKFDGMRKAQEFDVYPIKPGEQVTRILIQSDTRIGYIYTETGAVELSPSFAGGAYNHHLAFVKNVGTLSQEALLMKTAVFASASGKAGDIGMHVDNSGAIDVFGTKENAK